MEKLQSKQYVGTPFSVEITEVKNSPGQWNSNKVSIFKNDILIGEYLRNYSNYSELTFHPFECNSEWYALYSPHYTATRVLKLYDNRIEDWCGEDPASNGFCPVEYYVPRYKRTTHVMTMQDKVHNYDCFYIDNEYKDINEFLTEELTSIDPVTFNNTDFGFLCGCVWGDDTSWKIRFIDLSKIPAKILDITDKFGYWEMPQKLTLKECVDMRDWEPDHNWIALTRVEHFNLKTNERC